MERKMAAQIQAEKTYSDFIAWSKIAFYWILAVFIVLAFFNFGADGTGNQYNFEVSVLMNVG